MRKRRRNVLTLVSAILCVGSLSLVGRSFVREDAVVSYSPRLVCGANTVDGKLVLWRTDGDPAVPPSREYYSVPRAEAFPIRAPIWEWVEGAPWLGIARGKVRRSEMVLLPLWIVPIVTAIPPIRWWRKRRREGGRGFAVNAAAKVDDHPMAQ